MLNPRLQYILGDIAQHALHNDRRLNLSLTFIAYDVAPGIDVKIILFQLGASLQVLLYLSMSIDPQLLPAVVATLHHPAPNLRALIIPVDPACGPCLFSVPASMFAGAAPKLRHLVLHGFSLGQDRVPVFSQLSSVHLRYINGFPDINYALHFPRVVSLHLSYFAESGYPPPAPFNLAGLHLRKLTITDAEHCALTPAVSRWISITYMPTFEHSGTHLHGDDPLWQDDDIGAVSMRLVRDIVEGSGVTVHIVPVHRRWRRRYNVEGWYPDRPCPIRALTRLPLAQCLTYLRTENVHLIALLEANWPALDALRDMHIDFHSCGRRAAMVWPPDWAHTLRRGPCVFGPEDVSAEMFAGERYRCLQCPVLETLALCYCERGAAMAIESREVAFLSRALSQCAWSAQERAALFVVGVDFKTPVADALLEKTFSSVPTDKSSRAHLPWARDSGLWDEEWDQEI